MPPAPGICPRCAASSASSRAGMAWTTPRCKLIATPRGKAPVPRALATAQAREVTEQIAEMSDAAAMQARDTALFTLLYGCGLRIAEALALDVRDAPGDDAAGGRQGRQGTHRAGAAGGARGCRRLAVAAPRSAAGQPAVSGCTRQGASIRRWRSARCGTSAGCTACRSMRRRTHCATRLRRTCWPVALTCARSRTCSDMPACPPRSATRRWMRRGWWRYGARRIPGLDRWQLTLRRADEAQNADLWRPTDDGAASWIVIAIQDQMVGHPTPFAFDQRLVVAIVEARIHRPAIGH